MDGLLAKRALVGGGGARAVAYVLGTLMSAGSAALVLRHLGPERYGAYAAAFALAAFALQAAEEGSATYAVRELAAGRADGRAILRVRIAFALAAAAGALLVAAALDLDVAGTALAVLAAVCTVAAMTAAVRWRARMDLGRVAALELSRAVLVAVALAVAVLAGAGVTGLLGAALPASLALVLVAARLDRRRADRGAGGGLSVRGALATTAATALAAAYTAASVPVVAAVADATEAGEYGAAFRIFFVVSAVPGLLASGALPLLAVGWRPERATRTAVGAGAVLGALLAGVAPLAVAVLAGGAYDDAAAALRWLALSLPGTAVAALVTQQLLAAGRTRTIATVYAVGLAVLALVLTRTETATAAAAVVAAVELLVAALLALLARPLRSFGPQPAA